MQPSKISHPSHWKPGVATETVFPESPSSPRLHFSFQEEMGSLVGVFGGKGEAALWADVKGLSLDPGPCMKKQALFTQWRACLWEVPVNICGWRGRDGESEPPPTIAPWLWEIPWSFLNSTILEASGDLALLPGNLALLPGNRALLNHTAASTPSTHSIPLFCQEQGPFNPHTYVMHPFFA